MIGSFATLPDAHSSPSRPSLFQTPLLQPAAVAARTGRRMSLTASQANTNHAPAAPMARLRAICGHYLADIYIYFAVSACESARGQARYATGAVSCVRPVECRREKKNNQALHSGVRLQPPPPLAPLHGEAGHAYILHISTSGPPIYPSRSQFSQREGQHFVKPRMPSNWREKGEKKKSGKKEKKSGKKEKRKKLAFPEHPLFVSGIGQQL